MNYHTLLHSPIVPTKAVPLIEKAGRTNAPVLILGEKGTAKELVAKLIHHSGEWKSRHFYKVDCKFLNEQVFKEQLSSFTKGASEGSIRGTLFLKEIGALGQTGQLNLLDVMEKGVFQFESERNLAQDLRIICSSSENLMGKVIQGQFLEDLYDRLNTLPIPIPSLRERSKEIPAIAHYLLEEHSPRMKLKKMEISPDALRLLETYWWPGNLREFERVILRSAVLSESENLTTQDLIAGLENERNSFISFVKKTKRDISSGAEKREPQSPPLPIFLIELVHRIRNPLVSIKTFTQLLKEKFNDPEYRDYFYRIVSEDIEKIDSVLDGLLTYIRMNTPVNKSNTVHLLLEEILEKRSGLLEAKKIKVFKKFKKDLPETAVHDVQLRYILDTLLQVAVASTFPEGSIGLLTKTVDLSRMRRRNETGLTGEDRHVEILIVFTGSQPSAERFETVLGISSLGEDDSIELELRLVKEIIVKNRGIMTLEENESKTRTLVSLRFPVERRKVVYYPGTDS
jgi:nitrogen-specific signal transduction histidine kinase